MFVRFNWLTVLYKSSIFLFCLIVLSIIESRVLKPPTTIVDCLFLSSIYQCLLHIWGGSAFRYIYAYNYCIFLNYRNFYQYIMSFFVSYYLLLPKCYFVWWWYRYPGSLMVTISISFYIIFVSLYLKWVSFKRNLDGSCISSQS